MRRERAAGINSGSHYTVLFFSAYFIYYAAYCIFSSYTVLFLTERAYSATVCGIITSLTFLANLLMEPVGELKVTVPDSYMGDVMGDLNKRRGRVMGMDPAGNGEQVITAEVPMGEMSTYAIDLRSMTQSRGTFTLHFVRYEDCPPAAQEKAIAEAKARNEE